MSFNSIGKFYWKTWGKFQNVWICDACSKVVSKVVTATKKIEEEEKKSSWQCSINFNNNNN